MFYKYQSRIKLQLFSRIANKSLDDLPRYPAGIVLSIALNEIKLSFHITSTFLSLEKNRPENKYYRRHSQILQKKNNNREYIFLQ